VISVRREPEPKMFKRIDHVEIVTDHDLW